MRGPTRLAQPDPDQRRAGCRFAAECVGRAASAGWPGMSCAGCTRYEAMSPDELRRDVEGCAALLEAIADGDIRGALLRLNGHG